MLIVVFAILTYVLTFLYRNASAAAISSAEIKILKFPLSGLLVLLAEVGKLRTNGKKKRSSMFVECLLPDHKFCRLSQRDVSHPHLTKTTIVEVKRLKRK